MCIVLFLQPNAQAKLRGLRIFARAAVSFSLLLAFILFSSISLGHVGHGNRPRPQFPCRCKYRKYRRGIVEGGLGGFLCGRWGIRGGLALWRPSRHLRYGQIRFRGPRHEPRTIRRHRPIPRPPRDGKEDAGSPAFLKSASYLVPRQCGRWILRVCLEPTIQFFSLSIGGRNLLR